MKQYKLPLCLFIATILAILPLFSASADDSPPVSPIPPDTITLSETSVTKYAGDEFTLTAALTPENATETALTWSSADAGVAAVSPEGKVLCVGVGSTTVTAATANGLTASCAVKVLGVDLKGIAFDPKSMTVGINETKELVLSFTPANATDKTVKWSTSDKKIAKVSKTGRVTGVLAGTAVITATAYNGKKASCKVKVKEIEVSSVKLNLSSYESVTGETFSLKAEVTPANASFKKITWSSDNDKVAKVSSKGAVKLVGAGKATITATACGGKKAVCKVSSSSRFKSAHYTQSDSKWKFCRSVRKTACMVSSFAIMLENADISATPRTVYKACGSTSLDYGKVCKKFSVKTVNALSEDSPYLKSFNGNETYIKNPKKNYIPALKEALKRNPEGVCVYFKRGGRAHMMVAIGYIGSKIYYSDPGRDKEKGLDIRFSSTWVSYRHRMTYKNVQYMIAIDPK